jgi:hypothetical protein
MKWIIECQLPNMGDLAWNETTKSWELDDFETFNDEDKMVIELPYGGQWLQV